jgi:hypothetical protein
VEWHSRTDCVLPELSSTNKARRASALNERAPASPAQQVFCHIDSDRHISACITAAQAVLLNPSHVAQHQKGEAAYVPVLKDAPTFVAAPSAAFDELGDPSNYELLFTNNSVVLEVEGAEADLTIVDLPGIIQFHEQGQRYVDLIKSMVTNTIQQDHTIIVMALTAVDDLENQVMHLAAIACWESHALWECAHARAIGARRLSAWAGSRGVHLRRHAS